MKYVPFALLVVLLSPACGGDKAARRGQGGPQFAMKRPKPARKSDDPYKNMTLENEVGRHGHEDDVEATIQEHIDDVRGCYARAGKAQKYAEGKVLLRFLVRGDGQAQDVWVLESTLGNYDVERCLVEVGRHIHFHAPGGNKPTTFEYPVEFRSSSGVEVLDIEGPKVDRDLASLMPQLAACGRVADAQVNAIVYVEPNGLAGSVGLATAAAVDEDAGDCVVQTIRARSAHVDRPARTTSSAPTQNLRDPRRERRKSHTTCITGITKTASTALRREPWSTCGRRGSRSSRPIAIQPNRPDERAGGLLQHQVERRACAAQRDQVRPAGHAKAARIMSGRRRRLGSSPRPG